MADKDKYTSALRQRCSRGFYLGIGTINVVCLLMCLFVPTPAELFDYISALQFFDILCDLLKNVELKWFEPDVRILITKYSNASLSPWMKE